MKISKTLLVILITILFHDIAIGQINLNNGLVGYFPLDSNAIDQSPTAVNGVVNNATLTFGKNNNPDSAYYFNGFNSNINGSTNGRGIVDTVSVSVWVKTSSSNTLWILGKYDWTVDRGFHLLIQNGHPVLAGRNNGGAYVSTNYPNSTNLINDGNWHYLYAEVAGNTWSLWIDCVLDSSVTSSSSFPSLVNNHALSMGISTYLVNGSSYIPYSGSIDEVRIYNRVLTASERALLCDINYVDPVLTIPTVSNDTAVCEGTSLTLSAVSDTGTIYWESPLGTIVDTGNSHLTTISQSTNFYVYSVLNGIYSDTSIIVVDTMMCEHLEIQAPTVSGGQSVCENEILTLLAIPDTGMVYWESPLGTVIDSGNTHTATITQDVDFYVYSTLNGVSSGYSVISITVLYVDTSITQNGFTLTANQGGVAYQWIDCDNWTIIPGETNQSFTPSISGYYALAVTSGNCSDTSRCVLVDGLSVNSILDEDEFQVYPNPLREELTIVIPNNLEVTKLTIVDVSGKSILIKNNVPLGLVVIDFRKYASGVYFVKVMTAKGLLVKKIVKQ